MKIKRFSIVITILVVTVAAIFGAANLHARAAAICTPATAITVPFAKDGAGDFCYVATSLCTNINSWNVTTLEVNGTSYLNTWVAGSSIPAVNGTYTIHYNSAVAWGHFEIDAPCGTNPTATTGGSTNTPTRVPSTITPTPDRTITMTNTIISPTATRTNTPGGPTATRTNTPPPAFTATRTITPVAETAAPTATRTPTTGPVLTPTATTPAGAGNVGNATWFDNLGSPYGGCGIMQSALDTQNFIALNVQNSPGDYTSFYPRPLDSTHTSVMGTWNNGHNCGRWVKVTISDYCNGTNDGAQNQPFCRGGLGYVADAYNGATLDMQVSDSCYDSNAWCRDDRYHIDLAHASLNTFLKNGVPVGDMEPLHWNNRHVSWQFETAPNYTGDINIGFIQGAQLWWTPVGVTHLQNGIHGMDYFNGTSWVSAAMDADLGQVFMVSPVVAGTTNYQIRVYDVNDQLINGGRIYSFSLPAACGTQCSAGWTSTTYTTTQP